VDLAPAGRYRAGAGRRPGARALNPRLAAVDDHPLPVLESPRLPAAFAHGFPTREGGVSEPPYQSLNFGRGWGDREDAVLENRRRFARALGIERLFLIKQVHGNQVVEIRPGDEPGGLAGRSGDALISDVPGAGLGVFSADCVPILFADPTTGACGAAHAGWRGVIAGVAGATVAALTRAYRARSADLRIALGPAIGPCCFEVGPEVVQAFEARHPRARDERVVVDGRGPRPHVDLKRSLLLELEAAGVPPAQIDAGPECTVCDPAARFYSYRRDNTRTGQHLAVIARRPATSP
jgi:polyphenol oxidase